MALLLILGLILIGSVVAGAYYLVERSSIPASDTQRRAEFDRKARKAMIVGGAVAGGALLAAVTSDRRNSANFARSWDLDKSQFEARRAAQQTALYNGQVAAYNRQVAMNNAAQPVFDPVAYNNAVARDEVWWIQHGGRAY